MEKTVRSCLSLLFKELLSNALSLMPAPLNLVGGEAVDEKWREQWILELEVYSKGFFFFFFFFFFFKDLAQGVATGGLATQLIFFFFFSFFFFGF
jgi:hypothetical protein